MVYQGKPSAGCVNCRKRKIKCDEGTPACSQCINTKRICPGYVARFDLVLRDQTKAVRRKAQRKKLSDGTNPRDGTAVKERRPSGEYPSGSSEEATSAASVHPSNSSADWIVIKKRSSSPEGELPRVFNDFPEQQAICAFFLDFVLSPRHPDSVRGHLEHLLPLYRQSSPDSPLSLATSSVALLLSGTSQRRAVDQQLGRTTFGRALLKTSTAIRDPIDSIKDETLMAVLLLGLYERINASGTCSKTTDMSSTHNAGAAALVKHRGPANCSSPLAIGLLFAVRTQLVEHAIEEGQGFKRCPDELSAIFKALPQNASARLTSATINIADLRSCAKTALRAPHSPDADREVTDLLEYAISIDLLVAAWQHSVPDTWAWCPADAFDLPSPFHQRAAFLYTGTDRMDTYLDLWVLSIWNQYRAARLKIQAIILDCIAYLGPAHDEHWYWRGVYARMVAQQMADDICASVPFALGTKAVAGGRGMGGSEGVVEYPYVSSRAGSSKASPEHRRAAVALGGWHLLDPLKSVLRVQGEGVLREGQMEWVQGQMERIGRIYALGCARGVDEPMSGGGAERSMFERNSYEFPV